MFTCACQEYRTVEYDERIHSLEEIRQRCCVIHNLLIPDDIWEEYKNFETATRDAAVHSPTIFLSLLRGNLQKITSPIHKYLFDGDKPKSALTTQYKKDLQERWMFEEDIISRHHKEKSFQGRIAEMQTVEWLENHAWRINNLEALGGNSDIEAIRPIDQKSSIEVKYIGERDEELEQSIRALSGLPAGGRSPTHVGCNYL
jgi:hypothetical protein